VTQTVVARFSLFSVMPFLNKMFPNMKQHKWLQHFSMISIVELLNITKNW